MNLGDIISDECNDASDILNRKHSLCGQINNVICYSSNRNSVVIQSLMNAYCSSLYGCDLWDLSHPGVQNVCTAWKRGLRRIWCLPYDDHSNLLSLLSDCLPIFDLICLRSVNFLQKFVSSDSSFVNFISFYGIFYGRSFSPIGRNTLFCCKRYNITFFDFIHIDKNYITRWYNNTLIDELIRRVSMLAEVLFIRDGSYMLPGFDLQESELRTYINYLSRCD